MTRGVVLALALAGVLAAGCATVPEKERPTAADVLAADDEARILGEKARVRAAWAGELDETVAAQTSSLRHRLRQFGRAAGVQVPEIGAVDTEGRIVR